MNELPRPWFEDLNNYVIDNLKLEATKRFATHQLPTDSLSHWKSYAKELREKIWKKLGTVYEPNLALNMQETGSVKMKGYSVKNITWQSRPGIYTTGNIYVPDGPGPFPAVINMHGHWSQGRLAGRVQSRGHSLAQNGYVCLCLDAWGSGERSSRHGEYEYHGSNLGASLMNIGETLMGAQVVDNMSGVSLLASLKYVNAEKIGATGASGGGNQTMWLAAMDERIVAAVPVVSVGTFESYVGGTNCVCELLPEGLTIAEESAIIALMAPRAVKICNCLHDCNPTFSPSEMLRTYNAARQIFSLYKAEDQQSYQIFNRPHGFFPEIRESMLGWFELHLKGKGIGAPKQEAPLGELPEQDLMIFETGKRPAEVISIAAYCNIKGTELRKTFLKRTSFSEKIERKKLEAMLLVGMPLEPIIHEYGKQKGWDKLCIETNCGKMLPILLKANKKSLEYRIFTHSAGMEKIPDEILQKAQKEQYNIVLVDLSGTGQTAELEPRVCDFHQLSRSLLWLGRTLMGEWTRELDCVNSVLRLRYKADNVSFHGYGDTGLAALFAAALYGKVSSVTLESAPLSYQFFGDKIPINASMAMHIPGFLKWGDLSLAAALANCPTTFINPVFTDGSKLDESDVTKWKNEFNSIRKKCRLGDDRGDITIISNK